MKIALVHDWLISEGGGEEVLKSIYDLYPSPIYTLVANPRNFSDSSFLKKARIVTSFIQSLPGAAKIYRKYLPFFPIAIEQFDLSDYDVIISSCHAVSKGVLTKSDQLHICYCHTPIRYAWDLYYQYLKEEHLRWGLRGGIAKMVLHYIRLWDLAAAQRVDFFVANSKHTARRIKKTYNRDAKVIYPPVDVDRFEVRPNKDDFYLTGSRLVSYKRIGLVVEAFLRMPEKKLVVIGDGPEFKKIKAVAGNNIEILGRVSPEVLKDYMQRAKAFVFAAEEDFGIMPVEAQACGTPVIAYGRGGVRESVVENSTGIFFENQTADSIVNAIEKFEGLQNGFNPDTIRKNAERFNKKRFKKEFEEFVKSKKSKL